MFNPNVLPISRFIPSIRPVPMFFPHLSYNWDNISGTKSAKVLSIDDIAVFKSAGVARLINSFVMNPSGFATILSPLILIAAWNCPTWVVLNASCHCFFTNSLYDDVLIPPPSFLFLKILYLSEPSGDALPAGCIYLPIAS